jgi:hypothetical protein
MATKTAAAFALMFGVTAARLLSLARPGQRRAALDADGMHVGGAAVRARNHMPDRRSLIAISSNGGST